MRKENCMFYDKPHNGCKRDSSGRRHESVAVLSGGKGEEDEKAISSLLSDWLRRFPLRWEASKGKGNTQRRKGKDLSQHRVWYK